jgi:hypothetical protein
LGKHLGGLNNARILEFVKNFLTMEKIQSGKRAKMDKNLKEEVKNKVMDKMHSGFS